MTITIFVSYSHKDEAFRSQLDKHLAPLKREIDIELWFDGDILPGDALDPEIRRAFKRSAVFLALGSHNYLNSDYCFNKEYIPARRRASRKTMRVIVAMIATCDWKHTRMAYYKSLPKDGKPVDQWGNRNKAYLDIVEGLRKVVDVIRKEQRLAEQAPTAPSLKQKARSKKVASKKNNRTHVVRKNEEPKKASKSRKAPKKLSQTSTPSGARRQAPRKRAR